ncbi:hypothetical protein H8B02_39545 [Bradyrhizobium sp. Pear77]|uniref:hypothetical protein n=1 Tax=Bradyrhizobium altum TaxID=1571202 RepID=UPI001E3CBBD3|nr:hypothetical protein [Bradyrhizobium altum]MCC8959281.1 hypothetical protein [Bradyrhizobium altum]
MLNVQQVQAPDNRYQRFADLAPFVRDAIGTIAALSPAQRLDVEFLEREFIPALGRAAQRPLDLPRARGRPE